MKITLSSKAQSLMLAAALTIGLCFVPVPPVSVQMRSYILDINSKALTDLGTLGGVYPSSKATGINDVGQVVGNSSPDPGLGVSHAFITGPNGMGMTDLNSLVELPTGLVLSSVVAINNMGQIIVHASAIPEPQSYALMLAGLILVGFMVRRRVCRHKNPGNLAHIRLPGPACRALLGRRLICSWV